MQDEINVFVNFKWLLNILFPDFKMQFSKHRNFVYQLLMRLKI